MQYPLVSWQHCVICCRQRKISCALYCRCNPPQKKNPKHCFWKVVQWAWHISSHLWFGIGTVMASLREVSKEVLLSAVHTYCTLIYNAYLVICCATCDCSSSGFLLLLPYAFFPLIVFLPITCFCNFFFLLRRVKKKSLHSLCSVTTSYYFSLFSSSPPPLFIRALPLVYTPPPLELFISLFHLLSSFLIMYSSSAYLSQHVSAIFTSFMRQHKISSSLPSLDRWPSL